MGRTRNLRPMAPEAALFGDSLKQLREKRGLTIRELADAAAMSYTYLSDLERGQKVPSLTTLLRLALALECNVTALLAAFDRADLNAIVGK